jgi:hypothetical protein
MEKIFGPNFPEQREPTAEERDKWVTAGFNIAVKAAAKKTREEGQLKLARDIGRMTLERRT